METPRYVDSAAQTIRSLVRSDKFSEAISICERHIAEWPDFIKDQAWHDLAYVLWCSGAQSDAINAISTAIALAPNDAAHRDARARWALELRKFEITIADCTVLLEIEKSRNSEAFVDAAHVLRGFALVGLNSLEAARADMLLIRGEGPFRIWKKDWAKTTLLSLTE